ncbi:helix-turn-helix transcriptional regulator [Actinoplanes rectilineatus]|uniref:helix-turn-helix transcriptional regulator n=1 Tax=Actinoplanes rectilineatus TaxID=113571 RepID=UPI001B80AAA2|nr:helix-turn-helix domain-containing protein [Actinoplanes rectilineatus]
MMGRPPPIPPVRSSGRWNKTENLLFWVRTGSARVRMEDSPEFRLTAGEGVWIPATAGNSWMVVTEPGTVAFPLLTHPGITAQALPEPRRFTVPDGWQDWLIQHFNLTVTPLTGHGYSQDPLVDLLRGSGRRPPAPEPALPKAGGARTVAAELLRNPALDLTVAAWAARVLSSPRTLRRDFLAGTGLTFEQWRLRCRLGAAVELLAAGHSVDQAATRVGFTSRNGFARAFRQRFGATPHEFSRTPAAQRAVGDLARQAEDLVRMVRDGRTSPGPLPATRTAAHTNDSHVLCWAYRGGGYLDIGERRHEWGRGGAIWIPAGREHTTGVHENAISLPLGNATTDQLHLTEPLHAQFSPAWDDYLMFCSISARTPVRPDDYDPGHILDLFAEHVAAQRALSVPMPADPRAREVALDCLRRIGTSGGTGPDVPADIRRAFRDQTGMSYARWRDAARMRIARDLLAGGAKPVAVARRVGYAHLSTFSAAFSRFHGLSPRAYQETR